MCEQFKPIRIWPNFKYFFGLLVRLLGKRKIYVLLLRVKICANIFDGTLTIADKGEGELIL